MTKTLVTLAVDGLVTDPGLKANQAFAHYINSIYSQSILYYGQVNSLKHDVREFGMTPSELCAKVKAALTQIYSDLFDGVDLKVRHKNLDDTAHYRIYISGTLRDGDARFELSRTLDFKDGTIEIEEDLDAKLK